MVRSKNYPKDDLEDLCKKIRRKILVASYHAGACHIGSALSCVEILVALYYRILKKEDIFIFSKASGVATLYAILADKGFIPKNEVFKYLKKYPLPNKEVPGILWSGGSLGQGLSVATGLALADRSRRVFCLLSDGELQEGNTWEAILFAAHHKLGNLIVIIDRNKLQACGKTENILKLEPLLRKWDSFNWAYNSVDGHHINWLIRSLKVKADTSRKNMPYVIIANTIKGKGVSFMENDYTWHYRNLNQELFEKAINQNSFEAGKL